MCVDKKYKLWIHKLPGIGSESIFKLLEEFENEENLYRACLKKDKMVDITLKSNRRFKACADTIFDYTSDYEIEQEYEKMLNKGISMCTISDCEYPERLKSIEDKPYALYYAGKLPENNAPAVAIIGARDCSEYGTYISNAFGNMLAKENINIISGMARGVDGISQRGALEAGGSTYAVLGSGVDVCYPESNRWLYNEIKKNGGIISIFPPGSKPQKQFFPERNRIVSGLSDIVLVVEARIKSGTSITVDMALKQGKDVYAVPGRITDRLSDGCNNLIRQGAGIALSPEDIISEINVLWNRSIKSDSDNSLHNTNIDEASNNIIMYLDTNPRPVEEIFEAVRKKNKNATLPQVLNDLVMACIEGKAVQIGSGYFYKNLDRFKIDY